MARILITGSSDGIGAVAARKLIQQGHSVILHARSPQRADDAKSACPGAADCLIADISSLAGMRQLATAANDKYGALDAVVHNAGLGYRTVETTDDGLCTTFTVNSLAPYVLTSLMKRPGRLVFVSSGLHTGGDDSFQDVGWQKRRVEPMQAYSDSKLHNAVFSAAVARAWPETVSTSLDPGWVPTKLGSSGAPGDIEKSGDAIAWLATSGGASGKHYGQNQREKNSHRAVGSQVKQDQLMKVYEQMSGIAFPK